MDITSHYRSKAGRVRRALTQKLCREIHDRLSVLLVDRQREIADGLVQIVIGDEQLGPVYPRAKEAVQIISARQMGVVIVTERTFRYLLADMSDDQKSDFHVFIDEGLPPIESVSFRPDDHERFLQYFSQGDDGFITPAKNCKGIIEKIAVHPKQLGEHNLDHLNVPQFQKMCELVHSGNYDVYLKQTEDTIMVVGVLSPRQMLAFQSVTLIVAIFNQTLLPILWRQRHGIEFEALDIGGELFNTHEAKGPDISIHYVLHDKDNASKENLLCNFETGERQEQNPRMRVIYAAAQIIDQTFPNGAYCWAANTDFKNPDEVLNGKKMPPISAGLDSFRRFDTVVTLVCINPLPWVKTALKEIFDLEDDHLYELWRLSHTYQAVGRCSLRDRYSERKINMVVISRRCAEQLSDLFVGSEIIGQITELPSYRDLRRNMRDNAAPRRRYSQADNSAYFKYRQRCNARNTEPLEKPIWYEEIRIDNIAR